MVDAEDVGLTLGEVRRAVIPADEDAEAAVRTYIAELLKAGLRRDAVVQLARLLLLVEASASPWSFFNPVDELFGLKLSTPGFSMKLPEPLREQTATILLETRRKIRGFYVFPYALIALIATLLVALALFASPLALTVAVAVGAGTVAATAIAAHLANQHVKDLDDLFSTLRALPEGGGP